jgi:hypothetical protein
VLLLYKAIIDTCTANQANTGSAATVFLCDGVTALFPDAAGTVTVQDFCDHCLTGLLFKTFIAGCVTGTLTVTGVLSTPVSLPNIKTFG